MTDRGSVSAEAVRTAFSLRNVIKETDRLFHRLSRAADALHASDGLTGGERSVLVELAEGEPRTVPEMARSRPVTRQHIQSLVNPLAGRGLVELIHNPRHRRSKLVRITEAGREVVARLRTREGRVVAALVPRLDAGALETTARTLRQLDALFAGDVGAGGRRAERL
ncbi:MAG TPA: MarR family winged helix-turn-helix transcriptional regulator [Vicinamibacterales bacterium]|nr:MarR family winged helix-turn-helix transcriptional regulator [Vicinamibacterales bacterium]